MLYFDFCLTKPFIICNVDFDLTLSWILLLTSLISRLCLVFTWCVEVLDFWGLKVDIHLQLASRNDTVVRGCASFICFGRTAAGRRHDTQSNLKVGPTTPQPPYPNDVNDVKRSPYSEKVVKVETTNTNVASLKSSLKKKSVVIGVNDTETRKVQWTDIMGEDLSEIHEFQPRYVPLILRDFVTLLYANSYIIIGNEVILRVNCSKL